MIRLDIQEAAIHLRRYLKRLTEGERIVLCLDDVPIAELVPWPAQQTEPRPFGLARGRFTVPATFFESVPEELLDAFESRRT